MSNSLFIASSIGALQCLLFILLLVLKKGKKLADYVLLFWFLVFSIHLTLNMTKGVYPTTYTEIFVRTLGLLHGPLFLLYTKTLVNRDLSRVDLWHGIPFVLLTTLSFQIPSAFESPWEIGILFVKLITLIGYPLYVLHLCHTSQMGIRAQKKGPKQLTFSWIRVIAVLFLVSIGISMVRLSTELLVGVAYFELWDLIRYIVLVTVLGFFGLKYGMVYQPEIAPESAPEGEKYKHSPLKSEEVTYFTTIINAFFDENKAFLQPDFSLTALSKTVNIPKHHLSQIINSEMKSNFYDLVNARRIEYAMHRLREGSNLTLEGLGYECGFNSKSTFFSNFKKKTGKTPGEFKKEIGTD